VGEIVKLHENDIEKFTRELYELAQNGELDSIIIAGKLKDEQMFTGQCKCEYDDRKIHIVNLNNDLILRPFIQANYVTP
jgi:hypothetical protein